MSNDPSPPASGILGYLNPREIRTHHPDLAYILPMGVFLAITWVGGNWPELFPLSYAVKSVVVAILLWLLWPAYTKIRWNHAWLGVVVGIVGVVQWVGMEKIILSLWPDYPRIATPDPFIIFDEFASPWMMAAFIFVRLAGSSLVVPVMEELFWRDYLWRSIIAPNDFKLAQVGEWDPKAFLIVALIFGAGVHIQWMTAIVWGLLIAWLLVRTRSLGACIIAHGVTNFLLGLYVLIWRDWQFW